MPLRETRGPMWYNPDSEPQEGKPLFICQPFTTTKLDLLNWKNQTLSYTKKPQVMVDLTQSIIQTHNPTWQDCRPLLQVLLNMEEQRQVVQAALHWLEAHGPNGTKDMRAYVQLFQKLNLHGTQMKQKAETICIDKERL
jgi:hypothetical protein